VAALATALWGCGVDLTAHRYGVRERRHFAIPEQVLAQVELVTYNGSVQVRGWDRPEVQVDIERTGASETTVEAIRIDAAHDGGTIRVEAVSPPAGTWMSNLASHRAHLVANVPRHCDLRVRTGDGRLELERVDGTVDAETNDGSIHGVALGGDVRVYSGDGSIRLETVDGRVTANTLDGSIFLGGRLHGVLLTSGDGSISVRLDSGSAPDRDWEIRTEEGSIAFEMPDPLAATIDATTLDGVVRADRTLRLPDGRKPGRSLRARLGDGPHLIRLRSGDGSISLRRP
jgi:hypothetical protein